MILNEKLIRRADEATRELNSRGKDINEKLAQWNDLESALSCTRERELNLKHQKDLLESKLSQFMEELGETERDRDT